MEFRELKELSCLSLCNWCLTLYNKPAFICFSWGFYERKKHKESEKEELLFHSPMSPLPPFCALTQPWPCKAILCWGSFWWGLPVLVGLWPPSAFVCYLQASLTHLELSTAEAHREVAQYLGPPVLDLLSKRQPCSGHEHRSSLPPQLFSLSAPSLWFYACVPFSRNTHGLLFSAPDLWSVTSCAHIDGSVLFSGAPVFSV